MCASNLSFIHHLSIRFFVLSASILKNSHRKKNSRGSLTYGKSRKDEKQKLREENTAQFEENFAGRFMTVTFCSHNNLCV